MIDGAKNTQGYNRYSYVQNNPLNASDPTGFSAWTDFRDGFVRPAFAMTAAFFISAWLGPQIGTSVQSAVMTATNSAMTAAIVASATAGAVSGLIGGTVSSALSGGSSRDNIRAGLQGAGAGILSGAVQGYLGNTFSVKGLIANMIVGGTISELTGGKFANGAGTAAFLYAVQWTGAKMKPGGGVEDVNGSRKTKKDDIYHSELDHMVKNGPNGELIIEGTVTISGGEGTAEERQVLIDKANGTYTVKSKCLFCKSTEKTLIVNLTASDGPGEGDIHMVTRNEMAYRDRIYDKSFDDIKTCEFACSDHNHGWMYIGDKGMSGIQYVHEVGHILGYAHRDYGLMHPNAYHMYSEDIDMIRDKYVH